MSAQPTLNTTIPATDNARDQNNNTNNFQFPPTKLSCTTINIRGLNDTIKQTNFINECLQNRFNIIAIQETHFKSKSCRHIFSKHPFYQPFWAHDESNPCSGIGFLISRDIAKHIHRSRSYESRIMTIDFQFKGNKKLRLMNIYIPPRHNTFRQHIQNLAKSIVDDSIADNYDLIIMGDFNTNIDRFNHRVINNLSITGNRYDFLNHLSTHNFNDTSLKFDIHPTPTWNDQSRIDSIFVSSSIYNQTLYSNSTKLKFCASDHKLVTSTFNRSYFLKHTTAAQSRRSHFRRTVFDFDKMTSPKWKRFTNESNAECLNNELFRWSPPISPTLSDMNYLNDRISEILLKCAHKEIPTRKVASVTTFRSHKPLHIRNLLKHNYFVQKTIKLLTKANRDNNIFPTYSKWHDTVNHLYDIKIELQFTDLEWSSPLSSTNWADNKRSLIQLYKLIHTLLKSSETQHKFAQIRSFVDKRNLDLINDERSMIDSLMEREHARITLDRLLISSDDDQFITTDPDAIKKAAISHFQNCAGSPPPDPNLGSWTDDYSPKAD